MGHNLESFLQSLQAPAAAAVLTGLHAGAGFIEPQTCLALMRADSAEHKFRYFLKEFLPLRFNLERLSHSPQFCKQSKFLFGWWL